MIKVILKGITSTLKLRRYIYLITFLIYSIFIYLMFFWGNILSPLSTLKEANSLKFFHILLAMKKSNYSSPIFSFTLLTLIIYFFLSQYIVKNFIEDYFNKKRNSKNYKKILLLWIPAFIVGILFSVILMFTSNKSRELFTENPLLSSVFYYLTILLLFIFIVTLSFLDFSRLIAIKDNKNFFSSLFNGINFVFKNFLKISLLFIYVGLLNTIITIFWVKFYNLLFLVKFSYGLTLILNLITILSYVFLKFYLFSMEAELLNKNSSYSPEQENPSLK